MISEDLPRLKVWVLFASTLLSTLLTEAQPLFKRLSAAETGISFQNDIKETESLNVLVFGNFYAGGGIATGDINNDGLIDIYFTANMKPDKLYLNEGHMHFRDITASAKITSSAKWKTGVTFADVNGDGFLDIYVCASGPTSTKDRRNMLYINNKNLTFTEQGKTYGLDDPSYSSQASFFDYDRDGDLDMYLVNNSTKDYKAVDLSYLKTEHDSLAGDKLYRNDNNHFTEVTAVAGISGNPISFGLGIAISDINQDGWPDIYVSNDYQENDYLYVNQKNGTFVEVSASAFQHMSQFSMGNDIADINNDGFVDIITLDMLPEDNARQKLLKGPENYEVYQSMVTNGFGHQIMRNMLQINNGDGTFSEVGQLAGISNTDWSWAPLFADFDNDGLKDLFVSNGFLRDFTNKDFLKFWGNYLVQKAIERQNARLLDIVAAMPSTLTQNYIYRNTNGIAFENTTSNWGLTDLAASSGAAYADLDNDGDLDLLVNNLNQPVFVYENNADRNNHHLDIHLVGALKNKFAIGSSVTLYTKHQIQLLEQSPTRGFQSSVSPVLHFGVGSTTLIDSLLINWPSGAQTTLRSITADQTISVTEPNGDHKPSSKLPGNKTIWKPADIIDYVHHDIETNDFKRQPLMTLMYSHTGPVLATSDINNDGLRDVFIGNNDGTPSLMLLQQPGGNFEPSNGFTFKEDVDYSTADALFFDADNDGDSDLYVVGGTYGNMAPGNQFLGDRLYFNDGEGTFLRKKFFPTTACAKSCVRAADIDGDGDQDLFLGGHIVPGDYPSPPPSYIMLNDGHGNFTDATNTICETFLHLGIVTDAAWIDLNNDKLPDLIVVGEFMPISAFINTGSILINKTSDYFPNLDGWWQSLRVADLDNDGDPDLLAGNLGSNTQLTASNDEPLTLTFGDFDANGSIDPFLCFYIQGKSYPYVTRDELLDQMYTMRKKFTTYKSYADATLLDILTPIELAKGTTLRINSLETTLLENDHGIFKKIPLPLQAQFSPVNAIVAVDVNHDNRQDLVLLGNNEQPRQRLGRIDANYGTLLLNEGEMKFSYVPQLESGLSIRGQVNHAFVFSIKKEIILVSGVCNKKLSTYKLNQK